jgi:hypothetical protein
MSATVEDRHDQMRPPPTVQQGLPAQIAFTLKASEGGWGLGVQPNPCAVVSLTIVGTGPQASSLDTAHGIHQVECGFRLGAGKILAAGLVHA